MGHMSPQLPELQRDRKFNRGCRGSGGDELTSEGFGHVSENLRSMRAQLEDRKGAETAATSFQDHR